MIPQDNDAAPASEIRLLGPPGILFDGRPLRVKSRKALGLLAYLAVHADKPFSRDHLAGLLWGDSSNTQARANLRQTLSQLRAVFRVSGMDPISTAAGTVTLRSQHLQIDLGRLSDEDTTGSDGPGEHFDRDFLEGFSIGEPEFDQWITTQRETVRMRVLRHHQTMAESLYRENRLDEAIVYLSRALSLDPLQEHLHRRLMQLFAAQGRSNAALAQFERCRSILQQELDVTPDENTLKLHEEIRLGRVTEVPVSNAASNKHVTTLPESPPLDLPDKPSIAVLPLVNRSGDPGQEYFSDGLTEDITTELSRFPELFVIAAHSAFSYKDQPADVKQIARELGVHHVLTGSVRRMDERVRITARLLDGITGAQLWAERYDRDLSEIFLVQDEVARQIVSALIPRLSLQPWRPANHPTDNLDAYDYFLRGRKLAFEDTQTANQRARPLLQKSIELDPGFALAVAHLSRNHINCYVNLWDANPKRSLTLGVELGQKAVELDGSNPFAHFALSAASCWNKELNKAESEARTTTAIEPSFSDGHAVLGMIKVYKGEPGEALGWLANAMRLDPHYRDIFLHILALAYFHLNRYDDAVSTLKRRLIRKPESDISRVLMASSYGHLGDVRNARSQWNEVSRLNPEYSIERRREILPYQDPGYFEHLVEGLTLAGLKI